MKQNKFIKQSKIRLPRKLKKKIPEGHYCYTMLNRYLSKDGKLKFKIKLCPMYFRNELGLGDCKYLVQVTNKLNGMIDIDFLLHDQCKSCSFKCD